MSIFGKKGFAKERDKTWKANPDELYRAFIEFRDDFEKELKSISLALNEKIDNEREYRISSDNWIQKKLDGLYGHLELKEGLVSSVEKPKRICMVAEPKNET
jgi:hypothetical protein